MFNYKIKNTAWVATLLGLIPFVWFTAETVAGSTHLGVPPLFGLLSYGAIILSFIAGMIWMRAVILVGNSGLSQWLICMSVVPSLVAWAALLIRGDIGLMLLIGGFIGQLAMEFMLHRMELIPAWFWRLRLCVTLIVITLLCITWVSL